MSFSENLRKYRRERGFTQSGLAECLGVSSQAVSKWENGDSYPDATLLVPLASLLEISLDELFGRRDVPFGSLVDGLSRLLRDAPAEDRYRIAWDTVCHLQKAICAAYARMEIPSFPNSDTGFCGRSALVMNEGVSYLSSGNAPVFFLCPEGEGLTAADISKGYGVLSLLADAYVFRAFVYLKTKSIGFLFDRDHLALVCEIPPSEIARVIEALCRLSFVKESVLPLNGENRIFYTVTPSEYSLPLLTLLREMDNKTTRVLSGFWRKRPLLDPSSFE